VTREDVLLQRIQEAMKRKLLRELEEMRWKKISQDRAPVDWRELLSRPPSDQNDDHSEDHDHDEEDVPDDFIGSLARVRRPITRHNESDLDPSMWRREKMMMKRKKTSPTGSFTMEDNLMFNFSTIGGYKEIKEELVQVTDFMREPSKYERYNVRLPRGILLHGEPGTGKTLFAKCVAGECNIPFIATSGSEFQDKYVGTGAAKVRELFEFARQNTPCMIFIDEMDGIGRKRGADAEVAQAERDQTLNQLLVEMDGFKDNYQILVIGSTNRIDILDPALLRPGRFDRQVVVPLPELDDRRAILDELRGLVRIELEQLIAELGSATRNAHTE
jgi:SpoVK/Ycf46/Vps4 family AAA+-type ATPase